MIFGRRKEKKLEKENKKLSESVISLQFSKPVLGVPLNTAINNNKCYDGILVPAIVRNCIDYVNSLGLEQEGIYRVSPNKSRLDELEAHVNSDDNEKNLQFFNCHEASGLLKRFLRQLPEHILTSNLVSLFENAASECECDIQEPCKCEVIHEFKTLLKKLPKENYHLLAYVFFHAQNIIDKENFNKMGLPALGVLLQAILNLSRNTVKIFLLNASNSLNKNIIKIFDDVEYKPYVKPKTLIELKKIEVINDVEIQDELYKQYNLLRHLQEEMYSSPTDLENSSYKKNQKKLIEVEEAIFFLKKKFETERKIYQKQNHEEIVISNNSYPIPNYEKNNTTSLFINNKNEKTNFVLLEKQLLAMQSSLKEEIAIEKRKITNLLSQLREIHEKLSPREKEQLKVFRQKKNINNAENSLLLSNSSSVLNNIDLTNVEEQYNNEKKKRDDLIKEIKRLKNLCAELRAHLEHDTVLINNSNSQSSSFISSILVNNNNNNNNDSTNKISLKTSNLLLKAQDNFASDLTENNNFSLKNNIQLDSTKSEELLITRF